MMEFQDQVAIVTGAASGIGLAIAQSLLREGAFVAVIDINENGLAQNYSSTPRATIFVIDMTQEDVVNKTINDIALQFGRIDILVNCAGITGITNTPSHLVPADDLRRVFELNFFASFLSSKAVIPVMLKANYGRILHIASIAGKEGNAGMISYSASKAAVIGMTKVQGKEYAETGITVNALAPAVIQTALVAAMPAEQVKYMTDKIPMKRCGTLEEVTNIALYIVSRKNSFTTGFTFDLSGGRATY